MLRDQKKIFRHSNFGEHLSEHKFARCVFPKLRLQFWDKISIFQKLEATEVSKFKHFQFFEIVFIK